MPSGEGKISMEMRLGRCEHTGGMDVDRIMTMLRQTDLELAKYTSTVS